MITLTLTKASKKQFKKDFETFVKKEHEKKIKNLSPILEKEFKKEIRAVGAVKTGAFVKSVKARKTGKETITISFNRAGGFVRIKKKSIRVIDHVIQKLVAKMDRLYNNA